MIPKLLKFVAIPLIAFFIFKIAGGDDPSRTADLSSTLSPPKAKKKQCRQIPRVPGWLYFMLAVITCLISLVIILAINAYYARRKRRAKKERHRRRRQKWVGSTKSPSAAAAAADPKSLKSEPRSAASDGYELVQPQLFTADDYKDLSAALAISGPRGAGAGKKQRDAAATLAFLVGGGGGAGSKKTHQAGGRGGSAAADHNSGGSKQSTTATVD